MAPDISEAFLQQLVGALRESAAAQMASAKAAEVNAEALQALAIEQRAARSSADEGRLAAVRELKEHVTKDVASRELWWRWFVGAAAAAMVLGELLGVPVGRIISAVLKIHP